EVAQGDGLQAPGQAADQPGLVGGAGGFAEGFGVTGPQLRHGEDGQGGDVVGQIHGSSAKSGKISNGTVSTRTLSTAGSAGSREFAENLGDSRSREAEWVGQVRGC